MPTRERARYGGRARLRGRLDHLGDAHVAQLGRAVPVHQKVGELDIAVDDVLLVHPEERRGDLSRNGARKSKPSRDRRLFWKSVRGREFQAWLTKADSYPKVFECHGNKAY